MKTCKRCGVLKCVEFFHRCRARPDGLQSYCKPCNLEASRGHAGVMARVRKYQAKPKNRKKLRAANAVWRAVKKGLLVRQSCEVCGLDKVVAHHTSYRVEDRLNVMWLCRVHHSAWHTEHGEVTK